ncbi:MAG: Rid family hydrolase [Bacteroidota bacterium]
MNRREILSGLTILPLAGAAITAAASHKPPIPAEPEEWLPKKELIKGANSSCLRSGHLLFVGGIGGWYANRRAEPGDAKVQITSALTTMKEALEAAGSGMHNVLQIFMTVCEPNKNLARLNEGYYEFFPKDPPVRSFSSSKASQMGRDGILVQVGCIAYVD